MEPLLLELATTKIQKAEAMELYERKSLELRQSLQRENKLRMECEQFRETIAKLQEKVMVCSVNCYCLLFHLIITYFMKYPTQRF